MKFMSLRPSAGLVVAVAALFIALGGTSYAAFGLPSNSVGTKQLKNGAVSTKKLQNGAVTAAKINTLGLTAPNALHANSANTASNASTAANANHAGSADSATNANHAGSADSATNANHASSADTAGNASHADSADGLSVLPSGHSESGAFSGAGGTSTGGWYGFAIDYPRPLATPIANSHIVDTFVTPDPTHCPGAGQAAPGYLCLYFQFHSATGNIYGYSTNSPYSSLSPSVGVGMYAPITGSGSYANGVWTVTAP